MHRSSWVEVDLGQFRRNLAVLRDVVEVPVLQVLKSNGYGHGIVEPARVCADERLAMVGVATIGEAAEIVEAGISIRVLVMCGLDGDEIEYCVANGVDFIAWRPDQFSRAREAARRFGREPRIHVEIDSGMRRTGVSHADFDDLLDVSTPSHVVGLMTHFWGGGLEDNSSTYEQLPGFRDVVNRVRRTGARPVVHACNSSNALRVEGARFDMVRLGVVSFGVRSSSFVRLPESVAPMMRWVATVTNVMTVHEGEGVGYGWEYVAEEAHEVATVAVGYTDGLRRRPSGVNTVLLAGEELPVIGRICMDQMMIAVRSGVRCVPGDRVTLLDPIDERLDVYELARRWQTNQYDVMVGIDRRVPRRYVQG